MTQQIGDSGLLHTWGATGDVVEPSEAKSDTGWEVGERPAHEYMNWIHNALGQAVNHILKNGTPVWNTTTQYNAGASVQYNGSIWVAQATSTNSQPSDANGNWARLLDLDELDARYEPVLQHNDSATTDPGVNDDANAGYSVRSNWINTNSGEVFRCIDATPGAAVWVKTTLTLDELGSAATQDTGTAAGQIPVIGTASATTSAAGLVELLTQAEAEAGTDNSRAATILRVAQYIATRLTVNGGDIVDTGVVGQADGVCDLDGNAVVPAARFSNASHGQRGGGNLHAGATTSAAGFMSAADKQKANAFFPDTENAVAGDFLAWNSVNQRYERAPKSVQVWTGNQVSPVSLTSLSERGEGLYIIRTATGKWVTIYTMDDGTVAYNTGDTQPNANGPNHIRVRWTSTGIYVEELDVDLAADSATNSQLSIVEIRKAR